MNDTKFLGVGWSFPVDVDRRGRVALAKGDVEIEQAMKMIVMTPKGVRVMRPEFGCQIHDLLFAPMDATTEGLAAFYVEESLKMWEPRISVLDVDVRSDPDHPERMMINVHYEIKSTHDQRSLVFPFYRIPGEPDDFVEV